MVKVSYKNQFTYNFIMRGMNNLLLECKNVCKNYGRKEVLKDINLSLSKGKIIGLLGKNGSGKTTLIKAINGLLSIDRGQILIDGKEIGIETKKIISYLPERNYLNIHRKVKDIIDYFADFYEDFDKDKAYKLLADLDIRAEDKLATMSKGMREKVQLVLVMSRQAKLYILDEPMGGVDPATRDYILDTILSGFNNGATILMSTHLISDIERVLDEVVFIDNGKITRCESADKLRKSTGKSIDEVFREDFKC